MRLEKPLVWFQAEVKSPPFSLRARLEIGALLRRLQDGESLGMPHSRPMPSIGARCHELRVTDETKRWRMVYRIDSDAIIVLEVFEKKTRTTPKSVIETCRRRLRFYEEVVSDEDDET